MPNPRQQNKRPGDVTGRQAEILAEQAKEERAAREGEIALITAAAAEEKTEVVDLTAPKVTEVDTSPVVEVDQPERTFRVNTTLEDVTIGAGNLWTFEEGRTYKAPKHIYDHLEEKGYVWH